tara:strand:+ start:1247 stop:1702 length:456 start_codon:yes stop_codon:yes gene_type:complete
MIGFVLGWIYGHLFEWIIHRILHYNRFKKRSSAFSFHFREHHYKSRKNNFEDSSYSGLPIKKNAAGKEAFALIVVLMLHLPILYLSKWFFLAIVLSLIEYYYKHRRAHTDREWAKKNLPWHYDHHMGKDQDANFGVRTDWVDIFFGTRKYI